MCTGKCSKGIGICLYPLALVSIFCNILLFFPDFETSYSKMEAEGLYRLTDEIKYMGGVVGGGVLVLIPAIHIHSTGRQGCCANRCGMFLSIIFAAVGVAGALYSGTIAGVGLIRGPVCRFNDTTWSRPFLNSTESYLGNSDMWDICEEPKDIVLFNIGLFSALLVAACLELLLCGFQVINGLFGCICGTCNHKEVA
ncbi:transmembrane 4 L6 family member 5-like [Carassius gibelio]|uniref:transmembrane 4 L6 family member 5-like n=1 Tax=Carassius gibelio TaxID=101364 RepID=UPI002278E401|nr:transmembrane 4 L6 family member 5-like [Carassius gibelio]